MQKVCHFMQVCQMSANLCKIYGEKIIIKTLTVLANVQVKFASVDESLCFFYVLINALYGGFTYIINCTLYLHPLFRYGSGSRGILFVVDSSTVTKQVGQSCNKFDNC